MSQPLPKLSRLAAVVRRHRLNRHHALGPDHECLPVPVPGPDGLRIVRMLASTRLDEALQKRFVKPPSFVVAVRADSGAFVEARGVTPATFELADPVDDDLGELIVDADFADRATHLCASFDAVLPTFAAGPAAPLAPIQGAAAAARETFSALAEGPLLPYYRSLGKRFFAFLDRAAATAK